jgi:hypothetical protein
MAMMSALAVGVAVGVLTAYLHQERGDQPVLAAKSEQSSVNPAPIPAPLAPTNLAPAKPPAEPPVEPPVEPAGHEALPSGLPPQPLGDEFKRALEENPMFKSEWDAEVRDPVWAQAVEDAMRDLYGGNADLMAYGTPTFACKKTLCMVHMSASGISSKDLMMLGRKKSTRPLTLPAGTHVRAHSYVLGHHQEETSEYVVLLKYVRTTEQP